MTLPFPRSAVRRAAPLFLCTGLVPLIGACGGGEDPEPSPPTDAAPAPIYEPPAGPDELKLEDIQALLKKQEEALPSDPAAVVAAVGEAQITAGDVDERLALIVKAQTGGQGVPGAQLAQLRTSMGKQIIESLIDERLLDIEAEAAGVQPTAEDYRVAFEEEMESFLVVQDQTREEFGELIQESEGKPMDEFITDGANDPGFQVGVRHVWLIESKFGEMIVITEEGIAERYEQGLATIWTRPETVTASHILVKLPPKPADDTTARERAATVLALAKAEGADFAELAQEHSEGPSGPNGGVLPAFRRTGDMVEEFAAAAFALEVGEISEPVESQFGLHIIHVTDRSEEKVLTLETVSEVLRRQLKSEKIAELRQTYVTELRAGAEITYP